MSVESMPGELLAALGGAALYVLFYFFGYGRRPGLRKTAPSLAFGAGMALIGLVLLLIAVAMARSSGIPLRELDDSRQLPEFWRDGYWFSFVLMSLGLCEMVRAAFHSKRRRPRGGLLGLRTRTRARKR